MLLSHLHQGAADFGWALRAAVDLLHRRNPYDTPLEQYPMTAALLAVPFAWLTPAVAGGTFYGISSGILAFGLTRSGYHRLLVFLAYPYWAGLLTAQWPPLIMAAAFFPFALCFTLAKPQIGLPVALTNLSWRGVTGCLVLALTSIALMPSWPKLWLRQLGNYEHFVPLLVFPGVVLLTALLRFRDQDAQLLLVAAIVPQRWFFDPFILWLIPKTRRELVWTVFLSWFPGIWRWNHVPHSFTEVGRWAVIFFYLPMLAIIGLRSRRQQMADR